MWRTGVLVLAVLIEASADVKSGVNTELAQRLKRSPQYYDNCGPSGPPPRPPSYWPPPPPPPFWRHHHHPPPWGPPPHQAYSQASAESNTGNSGSPDSNDGGNSDKINPPAPCTTCGDGSNAVSNAKSDSGQAVAIAIARAGTH